MGSLTHTVGGSDNLVSFKSAARVPIESLKTYFKPKQDLHGYSKPWGPGCGKNLLDTTDCTPTFDSYSVSSGMVYCGSIAGGNGSRQWFDQVFPAGTYTMSAKFSGSVSNIRFLCDKELPNWTWNNWYNGYYSPNVNSMTFTVSESFSVGVILSTLSDDHIGEPGTAYDIQLEQGSTATSYEPYSNICPIEGWNSIDSWIFSNNLVEVTPQTTTNLGVTWTVNSNGIVDFEGTPTSWSSVRYGTVYLNGRTKLYGKIFGDESNVSINTLEVYDKNNTRIARISTNWERTTHNEAYAYTDLSDYPDAVYVSIGIKRASDNIYMKGSCYVFITDDLQYLAVPVTFPVTGKNIADPTRTLCENRMQVSDGVYSNVDTDTREYVQLQIQLYCEDAYTYIKTVAILNNITTAGRKSLTFEVDDPECKYIAFKHNGVVRDLRILVPFDYGLGTYTFSVDLLSADPTTIGGFSFKDIQLELGDTATSYEPYSSDNTFYGGYVDIAAGEIVMTHAIITKNTSAMDNAEDYPGWRNSGIKDIIGSKFNALIQNTVSNVSPLSNSAIGANTNNSYQSGTLFLMPAYFHKNQTEWISLAMDIQMVIPYAEPIHYPIPKQQLNTYLNNNSVWSNTNDATKVSYALHDTGLIRASKRRIAMNQPHIETVTGNSATFNTDMRADIKSAKAYFGPVQDLHGYSQPWGPGYGKNLFNISSPFANPDNTVFTANGTKRIFTPYTYCIGITGNNFFEPNNVASYSIDNNSITVTPNSMMYGVGYAIPVKSSATYRVSFTGTNWRFELGFYESDGTFISFNYGSISEAFETPANCSMMTIIFNSYPEGSAATYTNIQIEEGSTATSYEPYENICPVTGWNNITTHHGNKNLLDVTQGLWYGFSGDPERTASNGSVYIGSVNGTNGTRINFLQTFPAGTYTISCDYSGEGTTGPRFMCTKYFSGGTWNYYYNGYWQNFTGRSHTFTVNEPFSVGLVFISKVGHYEEPGTFYNIQLETGSVATTYEPYSATNIPVNFPAIGENLFDKTSGNILNAYLSTNKILNLDSCKLIYVKCNPNTTYTINKTAGQRFSVAYTIEFPANDVDVYEWTQNHTGSSITYTTGSDAQYLVAFVYNVNYDTITAEEMIDSVQVLTKTIYSGYIDLVNGELVAEFEYASARWGDIKIPNYHSNDTGFFEGYLVTKHAPIQIIGKSQYGVDVYCNVIGRVMWEGVAHTPEHFYFPGPNYYRASISGNWDDDQIIEMVFRLNEPIHYQLTPQQLKTLRGTNNIWSDANGNVEVKYWKH